jgi:hypothetical protein
MNDDASPPPTEPDSEAARAFREGLLVGILVGEGHFGGDGRQPQVTLRMHVRHESLFRWIEAHFPGGRLYGPYTHGGRSYYQWMARGAFLRDELLRLLERHVSPALDERTYQRIQGMRSRYRLGLGDPERPGPGAGSLSTPTT